MSTSLARYAPRLIEIAEELLLAADDWVEFERLTRLTDELETLSDSLAAIPRETESIEWQIVAAELRNASMYEGSWTSTVPIAGALFGLIREARLLEIIEELAMNAENRRDGVRLKKLVAESYEITGYLQSVNSRLVFDDLDWEDIALALGWSFVKEHCWSCNGTCAMALADLVEIRRSNF